MNDRTAFLGCSVGEKMGPGTGPEPMERVNDATNNVFTG
jgi:hypothetical protein